MIQWHEETDDDDNTVWFADSPLHDGNGKQFKFRIVQWLHDNRIKYLCESDYGCCRDCGQCWPTLTEAKAAFEELNETLLKEMENVK